MSTSINAPINPTLLIWARESAGLDIEVAAGKLKLDVQRLTRMEVGAEPISIAKLGDAASLYKRPLAVFFLPEAPARSMGEINDFRLDQSAHSGKIPPAVVVALRKASQLRLDALELLAELGEVPKDFEHSAAITESVEDVAARMRHALSFPIDDQFRAKGKDGAFKLWKQRTEALGIFVVETVRIATSDMRGAALPSTKLPVIVLNGSDSHAGRTFTLIHELTHLFLRQSAICDLSTADSAPSTKARIEIFCNAVAGEVIAPTETVLRLAGPVRRDWDLDSLAPISTKLRISDEVVLRRLVSLGLASDMNYRAMRVRFVEQYQAIKDKQKKLTSNAPHPTIMAMKTLGQPYVRTVLDAYAANRIALSSVSDYLGLKVKHIKRIEEMAFRQDYRS